MTTRREKINQAFKKASDKVLRKIQEKTVTFQDLAHLLDLCDDRAKLQVGYPEHATYWEYLNEEEQMILENLLQEKEYSLMDDFQRGAPAHTFTLKERKASFEAFLKSLPPRKTIH